MRKTQILMFAIFAVFMFGAMAATSAFAVELTYVLAEFLVDGTKITAGEKLATESEGEVEVKNESNGADIRCKGIFDGTIGANGSSTVTDVLNTAKELITELNGLGMLCLGLGTCLETEDAEAWPLNLPWDMVEELDIPDETFWILFPIMLPTYHLKCLTIIGTIEEECSAAEGSGNKVLNLATDVEANGLIEPLGTCTNGGAGVGDIVPLAGNLTLLVSGLTLQFSE